MKQDEWKQKQPYVAQIFYNALSHNKLAHAYMFFGDASSKKKEFALDIVASLVCEKGDVFACTTCAACERVYHNQYADLVYLDGKTTSIKKEDIIKLKETFSKTNVESKGKKVYILDGVEYASASALNSLLTFLEEPQSDAIAFLLVERPELVLDTIKSRCQCIQFKSLPAMDSYHVLKAEHGALDAYLLCHLNVNQENILEVSESEEYQQARYLMTEYVNAFHSNNRMASVILQKDGFTGTKRDHKLVLTYFCECMIQLGRLSILKDFDEDSWLKKQSENFSEQQGKQIMQVMSDILNKNKKSVNLLLLVDEMIYNMEVNK